MDKEAERKRVNALSGRVIGLCIEVHRETGPGLLESAYQGALAYELNRAGVPFEQQIPIPLHYKEVILDCGYRADFVVGNALILELKSVANLEPIHQAQILTYLKISRKPLGLLINFNVPTLKDGIMRLTTGHLFRE